MRVLILTNLYLTNATGGEEQSCRHVVEGLRQRGHTTLVLTSQSHDVALEADGVLRSLYLEMELVPLQHSFNFFVRRKSREQHNLRCLGEILASFQPDIIFIWGMWNLAKSLPALAEAQCPGKVVYRFATYWPTLPSQHELYWRAPARQTYSRLLKGVLSRIALTMLAREKQPCPLSFRNAICVSTATRNGLVEAGIPVAHARVIHTGVDAGAYSRQTAEHRTLQDDGNMRLLYAGRLVAENGIETVIRALVKLVFGQGLRHIRLTVAGSDWDGYASILRQLVTQARLDSFVAFVGHVPPEAMPSLLKDHDVLLVPSLWAEPFSRMVLEGMAAGLVLVATPTGGTTEILSDGQNGLLFAPGDSDDLAQKITTLAADAGLRRRLALAGLKTVMEQFTWTKMMDEIEGYLQEVVRATD
jgi:glycosyltransferase involved in cell wall biosynthesis